MPPVGELAPFVAAAATVIVAIIGFLQYRSGQRLQAEQQRQERLAKEQDESYDRMKDERDAAFRERDEARDELRRRDDLLWPHRQWDADMVQKAREHGCTTISITDCPPLR